MMTEVIEVTTELGPGALHLDAATQPRGVVLLGHGAGGSIVGVDLVAIATLLPDYGFTVLRYVQPWKVAGRKMTARPAQLDVGWLPAAEAAKKACPGVPLIVGGHSAGARVACRTAQQTGASGVLALSFPLHPPGKPESSRAEELLNAGLDTLVIQGERDTFGTADEVAAAITNQPHITLRRVPTAGHDLKLLKSASISTSDWWAHEVEQLASGWLGERVAQ